MLMRYAFLNKVQPMHIVYHNDHDCNSSFSVAFHNENNESICKKVPSSKRRKWIDTDLSA